MAYVLIGLGAILCLAGAVGGIWLLVEAFRDSIAQGFLCLCVPCYALYYAFARLESPYKNVIIGLWLGAGIPGNFLVRIGTMMLEQPQRGGVPF